jgi:hypothetical protein
VSNYVRSGCGSVVRMLEAAEAIAALDDAAVGQMLRGKTRPGAESARADVEV